MKKAAYTQTMVLIIKGDGDAKKYLHFKDLKGSAVLIYPAEMEESEEHVIKTSWGKLEPHPDQSLSGTAKEMAISDDFDPLQMIENADDAPKWDRSEFNLAYEMPQKLVLNQGVPFVGVFLRALEVTPPNHEPFTRAYFRSVKSGNIFSAGGWHLLKCLEQFTTGEYVKVTFTGMRDMSGGRTMKVYKIVRIPESLHAKFDSRLEAIHRDIVIGDDKGDDVPF